MQLNNLKPTFFVSLAFLLCLFLPWMSLLGMSANGWQLPVEANQASFAFDVTSHLGDPLWVKFLYLFYIIPGVAAYNMVMRLKRRKPVVNEFFLGLIWALLVLFLLLWADMQFNNKMVSMANKNMDLGLYKLLSVGYYVFLACSLIGMYLTLVKEVDDYMTLEQEMEAEYADGGTYSQYTPEPAAAATPAAPVAPVQEADRAIIYERLTQLHGLYEKGILGSQEYEAEKAALLSQLPSQTGTAK